MSLRTSCSWNFAPSYEGVEVQLHAFRRLGGPQSLFHAENMGLHVYKSVENKKQSFLKFCYFYVPNAWIHVDFVLRFPSWFSDNACSKTEAFSLFFFIPGLLKSLISSHIS